MKKILAVMLSSLLLTGCIAKLTEEQIANADYGSYPTNYEKIVKSYYEEVAKDPDSLKYRSISKPKKFYFRELATDYFGYVTCAVVNGKNSYGAYVGYKLTGFIIHNDKIIYVNRNVRNKQVCE